MIVMSFVGDCINDDANCGTHVVNIQIYKIINTFRCTNSQWFEQSCYKLNQRLLYSTVHFETV